MSDRIIGTVKWFNGEKGYGFWPRKMARTSSSISPPSRVKGTARLLKARRSNSRLRKARRVCRLRTSSLSNLFFN